MGAIIHPRNMRGPESTAPVWFRQPTSLLTQPPDETPDAFSAVATVDAVADIPVPTFPDASVAPVVVAAVASVGSPGITTTDTAWTNLGSGLAPRNGTTSHTISFGFTSTTGRLLVFICYGAVTHTEASTTWTEQLQPVSSGELSVFTKTSAGESSITLNHNGSDYPVNWQVFEFASSSSYHSGGGSTVSNATETWPALAGLPGTAVMVIAAKGRVPGSGFAPTAASTAWDSAWTELYDTFAGPVGTDGTYMSLAYRLAYTGTSVTPIATTTYTGTWGPADWERVTVALTVPAVNPNANVAPPTVVGTAGIGSPSLGGTPPTLVAGRARPVAIGSTVLLDVGATPAGAETISSYVWTIQGGGAGSLTNSTTATPTYTPPGSGSGLVTIRAQVFASGGGNATVDMTVSYHTNVVAAENALTGTARATWDLADGNLGGATTLQGFADGFSFNRTATVSFKIAQSDSAGWSANVYRLGYYAGNGARDYGPCNPSGGQVTTSQGQPSPTDVDAGSTLISAGCSNWSASLTWTPPAWAPSGVYVLKLNRTGGGTSHVLFILRDDARVADLMLMPADTTWMAYNAFGGMGANLLTGNSLYFGTAIDQNNADCARFVSYDRPVINRQAADTGASYGGTQWSTFFTGEYPMVRFLERNGIDVKYYGCIDAAGDAAGAHLIGDGTHGGAGAGMFVGHNEYWSDNMRAGWTAAKAAGVHVFSCAGNEVFWRTVGTNADGAGRPRLFECQKSTIGGRGNTRPEWTGTWRDPNGAGKGGNAPENTLVGTIFVVNGPDLRALAVPFNGGYSGQPLWRNCASVNALTSGQTWTSPGQILGFEWDTYGPAGTNGAGASFMAAPHGSARYCSTITHSINSGLLLTDAGGVYGAAGTATHRLVVHPGGNGAIVFGTGTVNWAFGVDNANTANGPGVGTDNTDTNIRQATLNILADMGALPATTMAGLTTPTPVDWFVDPVALVATAAIPTPTVALSKTTTATTVAGVTVVPAVTVRLGITVTPGTAPAVAAVGAPAVKLGTLLTPTVVAAVATVAAPSVGVATQVTPATVTGSVTVGSATAQAGAVTTPATVTATTAVAAVTTLAGASRTPATVTAVTTVATVAITTTAQLTSATVGAVGAIPTPTVSAGGGVTLNPARVVATAAIGSPTVSGGAAATVTPVTVPGVTVLATPTVGVAALVVAVTVAATASLITVQLLANASLSPIRVAAVAAIPAVRQVTRVVAGEVTLTGDASPGTVTGVSTTASVSGYYD